MKKILLLILTLWFTCNCLRSQSPIDLTMQLTTTIETTPPKVTFSWSALSGMTNIKLYRKAISNNVWGTSIQTLSGTATSCSDTDVSLGGDYEYKIVANKLVNSVETESAVTYIYAGINKPQVDFRGKIILLIDNAFSSSLAYEISQLENDLIGDGWLVIKHFVSRTDAATTVKNLIYSDYNADPINVKSVFIIGHVAVPYSGNINPDGHANHKGAWPADGFYADMSTGFWTDATVNTTTASRVENQNIPGDGKFDQSSLPSTLQLQVGRVDFYRVSTYFAQTELALLKKYFAKNHNFRHNFIKADRKALIDDNFGYFSGEAFASSGWRSFVSMFNPVNLVASDYMTDTNTYLCAYGCGAGTDSTCSNVGTIQNFKNRTPKMVFNMMFGSYFGDWDRAKNFMVACLASNGWGLTCSWAGRPHAVYHHFALGETIGYATLATMLNSGTYWYNYASMSVSAGLLGDPSLRLHVVAPPSNLTISNNTLTWKASSESVLGYFVYRKDTLTNRYIKLNSIPLLETTFFDSNPQIGNNNYMVRALKIETSNSGSYYNLSQGVMCNSNNITPIMPNYLENSFFKVIPNIVTDNTLRLVFTKPVTDILVSIFNVNGELFLSKLVYATQAEVNLPLGISKGIYFVKFKNGTKTFSAKFIVN